jgi:non-specific protein-tyrosine kinase
MHIETRDLAQWVAILRRWWWLLVAAAILAGSASYVVTKQIKPTYEATTKLFVNTASVGNSSSNYGDSLYATMLSKAYAEMIVSYRVAGAVLAHTPVRMTATALIREIQATSDPNTPLITIAVRDRSKEQAALLAEAVAQAFIQINMQDQGTRYKDAQDTLNTQIAKVQSRIDAANARLRSVAAQGGSSGQTSTEITSLTAQINSLQSNLATLNTQLNNLLFGKSQTMTTLTITEHAQVPTAPVSPNARLNLLLAVLAGLLLASGAALLMEYLDDSLKSPALAEERLKTPVIGAISRFAADGGPALVANRSHDRDAEAFKVLRTNIHFTNVDRPPRSLLITSPGQGDGKSTIAANYAVAVAQTGQRVIIVDADLRRPSLHRIFSLGPGPGLTDYLRDPSLGLGIVRDGPVENLRVVTSGAIPPNPSELLGAQRMTECLQMLLANADVVIVDTPPVLVVTDASVLANRVDGAVLIVDLDKTPMRAATHALQSVQMVGGKVLGIVVNRFDARRIGYGQYYYYYQSEYYKSNGHVAVDDAEAVVAGKSTR